MNSKSIWLGLLLGASTAWLAALAPNPSFACTPDPDNPGGCDGINGGSIFRIRYPDRLDRNDIIRLNDSIKVTPSTPVNNVRTNFDEGSVKIIQPASRRAIPKL